jgi:hypothetical protein
MQIDVDADALDAVAAHLDATKAQCELALVRALNRTIATLKTRYGREIARYAGLKPAQFVKYRVRFRSAKKGAEPTARFWAGLNEISLSHYRNRQTKRGVRTSAGGKALFIPHAFTVGKFGGNVFLNTQWINQSPPSIQFASKQFWELRWNTRDPESPAAKGEKKRKKREPSPGENAAGESAAQKNRRPMTPAQMAKLREIRSGAGRLAYFWGDASIAENILANAAHYATERVNAEFDHELRFITAKRK